MPRADLPRSALRSDAKRSTPGGRPPEHGQRSVPVGRPQNSRCRVRGRGRLPASRSSSQSSSSRFEQDALKKVYYEVLKRHDYHLPKPVSAKSGPLKTDALVALRADIGRFVREYSAALTQWKKDLSAVRRAASKLPSTDSTRVRALELVEKRTPEEFRDVVERSRRTLTELSVGLLNYVRGEYASRESEKGNGQRIIWIGSWGMDKCV
jgi:hypothetical protein